MTSHHVFQQILMPDVDSDAWTIDHVNELWDKWSDREFPMVRATVSTHCTVQAMNSAMLHVLGYPACEGGKFLGTPMQQFVPDCGALMSPEQWSAGFFYSRLRWQRNDGSPVALRMLFVRCDAAGSDSSVIIGVGVLADAPSARPSAQIPVISNENH